MKDRNLRQTENQIMPHSREKEARRAFGGIINEMIEIKMLGVAQATSGFWEMKFMGKVAVLCGSKIYMCKRSLV